MTGGAFEALAADYDRLFTASRVGGLLRHAVWRRLDETFRAGDRVLELGCGTGEDAVHLGRRGVRVVATDLAPAMVATATAKVRAAGLTEVVEAAVLDIVALSDPRGIPADHPAGGTPFDGVLSNFGGLNCVADLPAVAAGLAARVRPGGRALLCLMGPVVPWEWAWFLLRGQPGRAFRRLTPGGVEWRGLRVRYPTIGALARAVRPGFRLRRVSGIGVLVPPPYAEALAARHPGLVAALARWERRLEAWPPLPWLADHFLAELIRCETAG